MNRMSRTPAIAACVVLSMMLAASASAQSTPYVGEVTGDVVNVRSGPNIRSYAVTNAKQGQKVRVLDKRADWLGIAPVAGCYSVINARYVVPNTTGKIGTVTGENVNVYAAGRKQLVSKRFSAPQGRLKRGNRVRIIGRVYFTPRRERVQYYVIKPPKGALYWISDDYVRPATAETFDDEVTMAPVGTDTETETTDETAADAPPADLPPTAPPDVSLREEVQLRRQLQAMETLVNDELKKPVDERDLQAVLAEAKKIDVPDDSRFSKQHQLLLDYIRSEIDQLEKYRQTQELVARVLAGKTEPTPAPAPEPEQAPAPFDLVGVLQRSQLPPTLAGEPTFVLRDPQTNRIKGYAVSSEEVDLTAHIGKEVGLRGKSAYDGAIKYEVLKAVDLTVVDHPAELATAPIAPLSDAETEPAAPTPTAPAEEELIVEPIPLDEEPGQPLPAETAPSAPESTGELPLEPVPSEAPPAEPASEQLATAPTDDTETAKTAPTDAQPGDMTPPEDEIVEAPPIEIQPIEVVPVRVQPEDEAPDADQPAETAPETTDVAEAPTEEAPADPAPAEDAPVDPSPLDDPAVAELLEPIDLPPPPARTETAAEPTPLEEAVQPAAPAETTGSETAAADAATDVEVETGIPAPTAPEPPRPEIAISPAQSDLAPPVAPEDETVTSPMPVTPETTTPEAEPIAAETATQPETTEPAMPEPVTPDRTTPEPVAIEAAPTEPETVSPEPTTPEAMAVETTPTDPEPVMPDPVMPDPVAIETPPAEPETATTDSTTETETIEPVAVDVEPETVEATPAEDETEIAIAVDATDDRGDETETATVEIETTPQDEDDDEFSTIRPVSVEPIDFGTENDLEVSIAPTPRETTTPATADEGATGTRRAAMPAPDHSSPMPREMRVNPNGYEVEYD